MAAIATGDIWALRDKRFYDDGAAAWLPWVVVPTNLRGVMGRGLARQCKDRWPDTELMLKVAGDRNLVPINWTGRIMSADYRAIHVVCLAVKDHWSDRADRDLIVHNLGRLVEWRCHEADLTGECQVFVPLLGCGFGELDQAVVRPLIERFLTDDFTLVLPSDDLRAKYPSSFAPGARIDRTAPTDSRNDEW